uniref:TPR_REGION domain-containing protein n=1 Tax=Parastrongyloides trichosuri TaxID=131310 RepID=A0A0N4ZY83_PARTI
MSFTNDDSPDTSCNSLNNNEIFIEKIDQLRRVKSQFEDKIHAYKIFDKKCVMQSDSVPSIRDEEEILVAKKSLSEIDLKIKAFEKSNQRLAQCSSKVSHVNKLRNLSNKRMQMYENKIMNEIIKSNETPRKRVPNFQNLPSRRSINFSLNNLSVKNQNSQSDIITSTCRQKFSNIYLANMDNSPCNLKPSTVANVGVRNIKLLLGQSTPVVFHTSNNNNNNETYIKDYKFPKRIWPVCKIVNSYIKQNNKIDQILDIVEKLLKHIQRECGFYHKDGGAVLLFCAQVHYKLKFFKTSKLSAERALEVFQYLYGDIHISCAVTYKLLAMIFKVTNHKKKSLNSLKNAIDILEQIFGPDYYDVGLLHNNMGIIYEEERMFSDAVDHYFAATEILRKQSEVNEILLYTIKINIIRASYLQSRFDKSILQAEVFCLLEKIKESFLDENQYEEFNLIMNGEDKVNFLIKNTKLNYDKSNMLNCLRRLIAYYLRNDNIVEE